jgi:hypothetical protein
MVRTVPSGLALVAAWCALAGPASAQTVAEGPPKTQDIQAVERGFFLETDVGLNLMLNEMEGRGYGLGINAAFLIGYDILPFLSILAGAVAVAAPGKDDNPLRGDLFFLSPMAQIQFAFLTTARDFVYARGGIGFAFGLPEQVGGADFGGNGIAFTGLVGYEHYTRLRHFSIGATAGVFGVTKPGFGIGVSVVPTLKYTF